MTTRYLTIEQYAEAMQISPWAARRLCRMGIVKARNIGTAKRRVYRIPESEVAVT